MKKLILLISLVGTMWFTACGSDSSKEAKELLQRILNLVGIPQSIVINVCQDNNSNNFCESSEVLAQITIDKDDTLDTIWQKIFDNEENSYWLKDIDPDKKLLLVMQDKDSVQYDDGKFTLPFTIDAQRDQNATKELSILESMVDANYLNADEVVSVKTMDSVDKFYDVLLKDLIKNFNTLKDKNLDSSQSILANLEYMAKDLRDKGIAKTLPDRVNGCNKDVTCIDAIIAEVFKDLEITDAEADEIAGREKKIEDQPAEATDTSSSKRTMLLSKETNYGEDGNVEDSDTYQYDSNNRMISSKGTGEYGNSSCTFSYDDRSRLIESLCSDSYEGTTTTDKTTYRYEGDRLVEHIYNSGGELQSRYIVLEWSGNKPTKVEWTDDRAEDEGGISSWISTISYTGDNPTHVEHTYNHEHQWQTDREFDNKKTPYDLDSIFGGSYYAWGMGKNNILKEESTTNYSYDGGTYNSKSTTTNKITYNSNDLPIRIDTYTTSSYSGGEASPEIHTYTTYEYK